MWLHYDKAVNTLLGLHVLLGGHGSLVLDALQHLDESRTFQIGKVYPPTHLGRYGLCMGWEIITHTHTHTQPYPHLHPPWVSQPMPISKRMHLIVPAAIIPPPFQPLVSFNLNLYPGSSNIDTRTFVGLLNLDSSSLKEGWRVNQHCGENTSERGTTSTTS